MSLKSSKVAKLLDKTDCLQGCEECLEAYCFQKFVRGSSCGAVQRKLWLLTLYLRATDRIEMANQLGPLIQHLSLHVLSVEDGACDELGSKPLMTDVGMEAWNRVRRNLPKSFRKFMSTLLEAVAEAEDEDGEQGQGEEGSEEVSGESMRVDTAPSVELGHAHATDSSPPSVQSQQRSSTDGDTNSIQGEQQSERNDQNVTESSMVDENYNRLESRRRRRMQQMAEEREENQQQNENRLAGRLQSMPTNPNPNSSLRRTINRLRSIGRTTSAPVHSTGPPIHSSSQRNTDDQQSQQTRRNQRSEMRRNMSSATTHSQHDSVGPACTISQSVPLSEILMRRTVSAPAGGGFWTYSQQHQCLMMRTGSGGDGSDVVLMTLRRQNPRWDAPPPSTDSLPVYEAN